MKATQELFAKHDAVLVAPQILEKVEMALGAKQEQAPEHLDQLLDFLRVFVDRCHHGKEEDVLFPELERRDVAHAEGLLRGRVNPRVAGTPAQRQEHETR